MRFQRWFKNCECIKFWAPSFARVSQKDQASACAQREDKELNHQNTSVAGRLLCHFKRQTFLAVYSNCSNYSQLCSLRWNVLARKRPYERHPSLRRLSNGIFWKSSKVRLTDDGPLSSFQERSSSASSFHASLLQAIDGVMSLALCHPVRFYIVPLQ